MASSVPPVPNYVYVLIRLKMSDTVNSLVAGTLVCHYGETNDAFLVGGLVKPGETLMASAIRHCQHLVNFSLSRTDRLYLAKVLNGFIDHEPVVISIYIIDVAFSRFHWRARHHTPALAVAVTDSMNEAVVALEQLPGPVPPVEPPTSFSTEICGIHDEFSIYHWDSYSDKSKCFDYGGLITAAEIEDNLGIDVGIMPMLLENVPMRDFSDSNKIWIESAKLLRSKVFDRDLLIKESVVNTGPMANMARFLQKLEYCSGDNAEVLHNHLKQSKLKVQGFGIDPNSREAVTVVVSSFTGHLGNWAADHADEIFKLDSIDALTAYVRVSFSNEDLEGMNLYSLIKLDQFDKSLHEYTQEFNSSYSYWKNDISVKVAAYLYIGGLKVGALRADLMTNWQAGKYDSLISLQNDAAKNSLWRSTGVNSPRTGLLARTQNKGKAPMTTSTFKHPNSGNNQNSRGSSGSFGGNANKGASSSRGPWGHLKDAKADFKGQSKSAKQVKRERDIADPKGYDSWNKAKAKLTEAEFSKRRRTNACINCGEVGHKFSACPKPKP
jgi:hypothetical protein